MQTIFVKNLKNVLDTCFNISEVQQVWFFEYFQKNSKKNALCIFFFLENCLGSFFSLYFMLFLVFFSTTMNQWGWNQPMKYSLWHCKRDQKLDKKTLNLPLKWCYHLKQKSLCNYFAIIWLRYMFCFACHF